MEGAGISHVDAPNLDQALIRYADSINLAAAILSLVFCVSSPARAVAPGVWPEAAYNPQPLPDDLILPMPCGGAMAFRWVATPAAPDQAPRAGSRDFATVAGPFRDPKSRPAFLIGKYEVDQLQFAAVTAYAKSGDCPTPESPDGRLPAAEIGWQDAMSFADDWTGWLTVQTKSLPDCTGNAGPCLPREDGRPPTVRLPTETEWEFAARGGLAVPLDAFAQSLYPMPEGIDRHIWHQHNANGQIQPIGLRLPSPLGLHDIYGNVSEMLLERTVGSGPSGQVPVFIVRGGGRYNLPSELGAERRYEVPMHNADGRSRTSDTGFRVAVSIDAASRIIPHMPTGNIQDPRQIQNIPANSREGNEDEISLTDEDCGEIREQLDRLGFHSGPPPGGLWFGVQDILGRLGIGQGPDLLGERARSALAKFQKARSLEASGFVTAETRQSLKAEVDVLIARDLAETERQAERERLAKQVRMAEIERQAELERQAQLAHQAEIERQAELERQAQLTQQAEMERRAELERRAEKKRQARLAAFDVFLPMLNMPGGAFLMGCAPGDDQCEDREKPVHKVTVHPFRIGKGNVTQAQWIAVMGADLNPSDFKGGELPMENISWGDAQEFLKRLNAQVPGKPYRLPTEAEWEYAARGGAQTDYCSECTKMSRGKVWEWVQDCYHDSFIGAPSDGSEWREEACFSARRVLRGGRIMWYESERLSFRSGADPGKRGGGLGLRLAQDL